MRRIFYFWLAVGLWAAAVPHGAAAAPQILAVLGTDYGIPLTCTNGVCEADLSTFCLQRQRRAPKTGTAYVPATPGAFTLVVKDANGGERRLPAAGLVAFSQNRSYTSITARLPANVLDSLGAVSATIEVAANASILPTPQAGDPDPLTDQEIALAIGPLRAVGARMVDDDVGADTAQVLAAMANRLPAMGRLDPGRRAALWREVADRTRLAAPEAPGLSRATADYGRCLDAMAEHRIVTLRGCLELRHDQLMRGLNVGYWDAFVGS